jgi:hypothetical protein
MYYYIPSVWFETLYKRTNKPSVDDGTGTLINSARLRNSRSWCIMKMHREKQSVIKFMSYESHWSYRHTVRCDAHIECQIIMAMLATGGGVCSFMAGGE